VFYFARTFSQVRRHPKLADDFCERRVTHPAFRVFETTYPAKFRTFRRKIVQAIDSVRESFLRGFAEFSDFFSE
jgi:hypothetical protein